MTVDRQPLISVLTPVYNGEKYLAECIESVVAQTYQNWEYVIVNNCSTDRTPEIAQRYAQQDPRIRVHNNLELVGMCENHNIALRQISPSSKYCKFDMPMIGCSLTAFVTWSNSPRRIHRLASSEPTVSTEYG